MTEEDVLRMTPERKAEIREYPDCFDDLADKLSPLQLGSRIALRDAAFVIRELLASLDVADKLIDKLTPKSFVRQGDA